MRNVQRTALVGAAAFAVAVAGCAASSGQPPAPAAPSVESSASAVASAPAAASQPVGAGSSPRTTTWQWRDHRIMASIPAGWDSESSGSRVDPDQAGAIAIGMTGPVTRVYSDACRSEDKLDPVGPTAAELA